jgi:hypothetical protein
MFRGGAKSTGYPLHSPVFLFTSPTVRHRVPSQFNWTLADNGVLNWITEAVMDCFGTSVFRKQRRLSHEILLKTDERNGGCIKAWMYLNTAACCWQQRRQLLSWMRFRVVPPQNGIGFREKAPTWAVILEFGAVESCIAGFFSMEQGCHDSCTNSCTLYTTRSRVNSCLTVPTAGLLGQHSYTGLFCNKFWLEIYTDGHVANICTSALFPRLVYLASICTSALFPRLVYLASICTSALFPRLVYLASICSSALFPRLVYLATICTSALFPRLVYLANICTCALFTRRSKWQVLVKCTSHENDD